MNIAKLKWTFPVVALLLVASLCACANPSGTYDPEDTKVANGSTSDVTTTDAPLTEETTAEIPEEDPVFSVEASLAAIDQLASENLSVSLKYQTQTYDGLKHEFNGGLGQVNGKYWSRVDLDGTAILEEEGGYYHKYTFESSKWRYYDTYEMTAKEEFDQVFNGRYWWKNYLDELTFDAYDELTYTGVGQVLEQDCHMFSFEGAVTDEDNDGISLNPNYTTTTEIANVIVNAHSAYESIDIFSATDNIVGFLSQIGCVESPLGEVEKKINFEEIFINIDSNGGNSLIDHLHGKMPHREIVMEKVFDYLSE